MGFHTAVFTNSVLGGRHGDAVPVRSALDLVGLSGEVQVFSWPLRFLRQQFDVLEEVIDRRPDLVIVAHGGSEALSCPLPPDAGLSPAPPPGQRSGSAVTAWSRRNPVTAAVRREIRYRLRNYTDSAVPFAEFEQTYRRFLDQILVRTAAQVILVGCIGSDPKYFPNDQRFIASWTGLVEELAARSDRVDVIHPTSVLRRWKDYQADRTHLTQSGQAAVATLLAKSIETTFSPEVGTVAR